MAIPRIGPYQPPTAADLPPPAVPWTVEPARATLLVHDMQRYFVGFYDRAAEPISTVVRNIAALSGWARRVGVPVVFSAQPARQGSAERGLLTDFWGPGVPDGHAAALIDDLPVLDGDTVLRKWRYSAFHRTDLAALLAGRDQLLICGVYAHIGVLATACDAFMRDIRPFVVADAVADFSRADHLGALAWAARRCARVTTTADVLG